MYTFFAKNNGGFLGILLNNFFMGLFGTGAFIIPIIVTGITVYYFLNTKNLKKVKRVTFLTSLTYLITLVLIHTITKNKINIENFLEYYSYNISKTDSFIVNGGVMGSMFGNAFITVIGHVGTYILVFISFAIIFVLYTNKSLAKILATFGVNTTKFGISKTREASNKISKYTENIKIQREEKNKKRNQEKNLKIAKEAALEKELEKELALARKENLEKFKLSKPIPQKSLSDNYKKSAPRSVANSFVEKSLKEKSLKVPRKPNLFIIKEREEKTYKVNLARSESNNESLETCTVNKVYEPEIENLHKEQEVYNIPSKSITKQQQKVDAYYEEVKNSFTYNNSNPYINSNESFYNTDIEKNDSEENPNLYDVQPMPQSFINEKYDEPINDKNLLNNNNVEKYYDEPIEDTSYIQKDNTSTYEINNILNKVNGAIVEDNVIHGLFDYIDDKSNDELVDSINEYNNLYDDFDIIDDLEEEANAFDKLNDKLNDNTSKTETNRFLPKEEVVEKQPTMEYDENDKAKYNLDEYKFPSIQLLSPKKESNNTLSDVEIQENSLKLEETLKSFGVKANVVNVSRGPTVTRYEIEPGTGVKVSKIANLVDDLALSLASSGIRIQAPIPNKPYVGIEVPNKVTDSVVLREVIDNDKFRNFKSKLAFAIGKDIGGDTIIFDIGKMPHVLVAGATGSGKSVCVNTLITSIIYKARPDEVKLLMIDPKVVELSIYNGIPHLLIPVVTDPKKANSALNWAVREMERRYGLFADNFVRNLDGYNKVAEEKNYDEILPRIVVIIDELADLMMTAAKEVEDSICRLAQKARAAGIHLIIATQRPSVDVITGLIKANIPTRMAFSVSSGIDSRTIIDTVGAERLLGKGDMLFLPYGSNEPTRVQGAFISDKEVENIVDYLSKYKAPKFSDSAIEKITSTSSTNTDEDDLDELFPEIVDFILQKQKASASMLQSKFRIGFNRASRIIDQLESKQFIGPTEGSKARKVIITKREWEEIRDSY